ncbi:putative heat shock protein Hsp30/Hsp42 [Sphaerosporella brunnea]|uniref:Putative heat shock protein Hsp30/Hsp42 n=1 Tax=Sphaerosporella brunnea TaxID=1250544 RepID=A0A5J5EP83_9PEZI|nr:putative heat shock protein Hsp30/Hsp42 [Sphaerosporella brunnea]KAA8899493.1 putative heat shock protein Hsp30/Hsp42 [Sphaerosporella brunnea]
MASSLLSTFNDPLFRALVQAEPENTSGQPFQPKFDVYETPNAYVLEGELPGLKDKKSLEIEFTDNQTVVIAGKIDKPTILVEPQPPEQQVEEDKPERQAQTEEIQPRKKKAKKPKCWVSERAYGPFRRIFRFPQTVDTDNAKASLQDGVLELIVPKKVAEKKKIEVE